MNFTKLVLTTLLALQASSALAVDSSTLEKAQKWMCQQDMKALPNCKQLLGSSSNSGTSTGTTTHTNPPTVVVAPPPVVVAPPIVIAQPPVPAVDPIPSTAVTPLTGYQGPERKIKSVQGNQSLFAKYCTGTADSAEPTVPKYGNAEVARASRILSKVAPKNFYFYGDIKRVYKAGLAALGTAGAAPAGVTDDAHLFLVQTCGEFRDRAEMVEGKIKWVNNMILLKNETQAKVDYSKNIWSQLSGQSYNKYLQISNAVFTAREQVAASNTFLKTNQHPDSQEPVRAFTVCETKYIIGELIAKGQSYSSGYEQGLAQFENSSSCSAEDKEYVYDFRGDSNFKQYSPEGNAMLWHAISIANFCASSTKSNGKNATITDAVCEAYFKKPFLTRYNAARSGLAAWLTYDKSLESSVASATVNLTMIPSFDGKVGKTPFTMQTSDGTEVRSTVALRDGSLSFNDMFNINTGNIDESTAFMRLRNAVNRHTNWYKSAYNDQLGGTKSTKDQAYSPFVASSYEMSKSNAFNECGYTVQCDGDGRKAWMLVFKIKKSNWYNTRSLKANNQLVDFDKMWIDETSFGTDSLADSERAFDRLGTALETELDTILYLHNLEAGSGNPIANDSLE